MLSQIRSLRAEFDAAVAGTSTRCFPTGPVTTPYTPATRLELSTMSHACADSRLCCVTTDIKSSSFVLRMLKEAAFGWVQATVAAARGRSGGAVPQTA